MSSQRRSAGHAYGRYCRCLLTKVGSYCRCLLTKLGTLVRWWWFILGYGRVYTIPCRHTRTVQSTVVQSDSTSTRLVQ